MRPNHTAASPIGVRGREVERRPRNLEVRSSIPGSGCQLWDFFIGPQIRREYWFSSQEAESREISISCKNSSLNRCNINMFKLKPFVTTRPIPYQHLTRGMPNGFVTTQPIPYLHLHRIDHPRYAEWLCDNSSDSVPTSTLDIRITSVNSTNQASDVCRRTTSGSNNNNPHNNVSNNMATPNKLLMYLIKQYEID